MPKALKSKLHLLGFRGTVYDLNRYINFDFNLVDSSIGQIGDEISGPPCPEPVGKLVAGESAREVDWTCAKLLGLEPEKIKYLNIK